MTESQQDKTEGTMLDRFISQAIRLLWEIWAYLTDEHALQLTECIHMLTLYLPSGSPTSIPSAKQIHTRYVNTTLGKLPQQGDKG